MYLDLLSLLLFLSLSLERDLSLLSEGMTTNRPALYLT